MKGVKILDCTIRDGGYYNQWDFSEEVAERYFRSMNELPIDIIEIGYRSNSQFGYFGKYFYCPTFLMQQVRTWLPSKELAIMLNEKDCLPDNINELLDPCLGIVDTIRMAIAPERFLHAVELAKIIKSKGFKVGFNIMYMSTLTAESSVFDHISKLNGFVDYFSLVDSYGGVYPNQVSEIIKLCKLKTNIPIGFHGHNNMELVFANSLAAIEAGCEMIDSTIIGMGRGAGNLKTELWLTHMATQTGLQVDFNVLSDVVSQFQELQDIYKWGTNLPYMVSGANSLPQKDVMDWVTTRFYSINSVIRALQNQKNKEADNLRLPEFNPSRKFSKALIIGGGPTVKEHLDALKNLLKSNEDYCIIHASSKYANLFSDLINTQFYCLVGNEGHRLEKVFYNLTMTNGECILPPYPRKMGTYIPKALENNSYELKEISFNEKIKDSHTALAIQAALDLNIEDLYISGYDGYLNQSVSSKEQDLFTENSYLFEKASKHFRTLCSITSTRYKISDQISVYQLI